MYFQQRKVQRQRGHRGLMRLVEEVLQSNVPQTIDEAKGILSDFAERIGFDQFSYVGGQAFGPTAGGSAIWYRPPQIIITFPEEWVGLYHERDLSTIDPIIQSTLDLKLPYTWDTENWRHDITPEQGSFFSAAHDFRICRGLSIPIYGPLGDFSLFTFISHAQPNKFRKLIAAKRHDLHLLALYYHQIIQSIDCAQSGAISLSEREEEILYWTAAGKTSPETGMILGLSEKTVQYHLYNSMKKLDVYSKPQAVAKAILLGLIKP